MDASVMHICCKWINKLEKGETCICCELLRRKYLDAKSIFQIKRKSGVTILEKFSQTKRVILVWQMHQS